MALIDLFRPRLEVCSKVFQVVFDYLVYNSPLFLAPFCSSCLLNVVADLICIFFISHPLVLLSSLSLSLSLSLFFNTYIKKCVYRCSSEIFFSMDVIRFSSLWRSKFRFHVEEWGAPVHYTPLFVKTSGPKLVEKCCLEFPVFAYNNQYKHNKFKINIK